MTQSRRILETIQASERETSQRIHGKNGGEWSPYVRKNGAEDNVWAWQLWAIRVEARRRMAARPVS